MMRHWTTTDYKTTTWAGGTTTELHLLPEDGSYAERSFELRISSATCDLPASDFTPLPGFYRELMILDGEIEVFHEEEKGTRHLVLRPADLDSFYGGDPTRSVGRCTDFNVIYRKEMYAVEVLPIRTERLSLKAEGEERLFLYLQKGGNLQMQEKSVELTARDSLLIEQNEAGELRFESDDFNAVLVRIVKR